MYETIISAIYGLSGLIKNKITIILIMLFGIIYLTFTNTINLEVIKYIDFNNIIIFISSYYISKLLIETNIINYIINSIVEKTSSYKTLIILTSIFVFIISGLINNIILLPFLIKIIEKIIKKNNIKSTLFIENIIIASILGSISTFIGSNYSIIVSSHLNMNFLDFFFFDSRIGIYIITLFMLFIQIIFINYSVKDEYFIGVIDEVEIKDKHNIYLFISFIVVLLISSLFSFKYISGISAIICVIIGLVKNKKNIVIDYQNIILYALLFVYIYLVKNISILNTISELIIKINSTSLIYTLFFVASIILSLIFNPIFIFYFLVSLIPNIVLNTNLISMPLIYATYFGLTVGMFKNKKIESITSYQTIILMFICSYALIAFLYF